MLKHLKTLPGQTVDAGMRIVIADRVHEHRLAIEKMLNALGYFRIITSSCYEDAVCSTQVRGYPIKLMIIEDSLLQGSLNDFTCDEVTPFVLRYRDNSQRRSGASNEIRICDFPTLQRLKSIAFLCSATTLSNIACR